jgi:hypothetical protein
MGNSYCSSMRGWLFSLDTYLAPFAVEYDCYLPAWFPEPKQSLFLGL